MMRDAGVGRRDREATEARMVRAVGSLLAREGFRALGVNALARQAGVDKALIYRYFGGLPGLLTAYAEGGEIWWTVEELIGPDLPPPAEHTPAAWLALVLERHAEALRRRPVALEILAWEMVERNELTAALAAVREARVPELMRRLAQRFTLPARIDLAAMMVLMAAATTYLVVRARDSGSFLGLDPGADQDWRRLIAAAGLMLERSLADRAG